MRHPSPAARAIRNKPAATTTAPVARATRSPARCETLDGDGGRHDSHRAKVLHLDRRSRDAQRKGCHSEHGLDEEVTDAHDRRQRRAGSEEQRRNAKKGLLGGSLGKHPCEIPRRCSPAFEAATTTKISSAFVVFVMAAPPDARLVAPLGGAVEPLVQAPVAR